MAAEGISAEGLRPFVKLVISTIRVGYVALLEPEHFLKPGTPTSDDRIVQALEFYFTVLIASTLFYLLLSVTVRRQGQQDSAALSSRGDFVEQVGVAVHAVWGLITTGFIAMLFYIPFKWMGGKGDFAATLLAYIYGATPYFGVTLLGVLILLTGYPPELRRYALSPSTDPNRWKALQQLVKRPDVHNGPILTGGLLTFAAVILSNIVMLRCLSYSHKLTGWRMAMAIVLSVIMGAIVFPTLQKIGYLFSSEEGQELPFFGADPPTNGEDQESTQPNVEGQVSAIPIEEDQLALAVATANLAPPTGGGEGQQSARMIVEEQSGAPLGDGQAPGSSDLLASELGVSGSREVDPGS